jgi:hypothetical protein
MKRRIRTILHPDSYALWTNPSAPGKGYYLLPTPAGLLAGRPRHAGGLLLQKDFIHVVNFLTKQPIRIDDREAYGGDLLSL